MNDTPSLCAIVMTHNEEANLRRCLDSVVGLANEILIVDSGSTDATVDIARFYTDKIVTHEYKDHAAQFNWALDNVAIASDWIMMLDADEYLLPELRDEIPAALIHATSDVTGFYMKRRVYFNGHWIKHGSYYPIWLLRIFRRGCARGESLEMDDHLVLLSGKPARLKHDFVDWNEKDLDFWTTKHQRYARWEVNDILKKAHETDNKGNLLGEQKERKRWLKASFYNRMPLFFRAFAYFSYRYFLRLGFLDGQAGLVFHFLQACWYRFYVDAKLWEIKQKQLRSQSR